MPRTRRAIARKDGSEGFGLIEVVIAVFILGIIAIAILPVMFSGLKIAADQSSVATATRKANAIIEQARANPTCANLASVAAGLTPITDGRGVSLTPSATVGTCAQGAAVSFTATVKVTSNSKVVATASTLIYIPIP